ncbi:hypothetical protein A2318_02840 [Candidatus Uhrbacteria bacterium RIFOXYB2_FULL_45_11]|uniref:Uncharacterized protein n=1 Tax=Candidatus Uhrbacteria bacterium RIFOXYB2_FULL_45_11 TaxID=1802421 RepID=A0A1F7W1R2_9BACT|nr:MAG: hypothetical protein A2318_02840 [Candidatus Uhrbacteria bacterium RIFOXYB2_FULL_45_11]
MTRSERQSELDEAGIMCSPQKCSQAGIAGMCILGMLTIIVGGIIFGQRPVAKAKPQQPNAQVAICR